MCAAHRGFTGSLATKLSAGHGTIRRLKPQSRVGRPAPYHLSGRRTGSFPSAWGRTRRGHRCRRPLPSPRPQPSHAPSASSSRPPSATCRPSATSCSSSSSPNCASAARRAASDGAKSTCVGGSATNRRVKSCRSAWRKSTSAARTSSGSWVSGTAGWRTISPRRCWKRIRGWPKIGSARSPSSRSCTAYSTTQT